MSNLAQKKDQTQANTQKLCGACKLPTLKTGSSGFLRLFSVKNGTAISESYLGLTKVVGVYMPAPLYHTIIGKICIVVFENGAMLAGILGYDSQTDTYSLRHKCGEYNISFSAQEAKEIYLVKYTYYAIAL